MAYVIGIISQKGGVGKSTLARLLATEFAKSDWSTKLADLDIHQATSVEWNSRRNKAGIQPELSVQPYQSLKTALKEAENQDVLILDGLPHADKLCRDIAKASDLVIIPTGASRDDRSPTTKLVDELVAAGVPINKIVLVLSLISGKAEAMIGTAAGELMEDGYNVLPKGLPFQAGYAAALDAGKSISEASHPSLRKQAQEVAQALADVFAENVKEAA